MQIRTKSGRSIQLPTAEEDAQINAGMAADADNPEWTPEDFARALPAAKFFSPEVYAALCAQRMRGPKNKPLKVPTTIRLDADVLAALKATGRGWQTRVNDTLRDWVNQHPSTHG
ncbi:BrnA antitoxin family protein [Limnohabitans planktonicus]|uniref:BrnA antitoxin family protein n=1 Tax=Limnohabitans planktonicus II-D5 TaxID=1293045 RepID=A0A2T7UCE3_9BURK|nr:BrnA antitoxin family protein [Limnohabitans planktonicus]PVE42298.1 hypothetical protein H663_013065 [Limnohabitans planktonicus II-D5]